MNHYVQTNGLTLHYLDHGGHGPTIILTHGLSANAHFFDGLIAQGLTNYGRVLSVDLRGRGLSDKPVTGYSLADHAADIIGLLDQLGLGQVVLGGHSFGGLLTLYMAAHYPQRISHLLILDAAGTLHPDARDLIKPSLSRLEKTFPSWEEYRQMMQEQPFLNGTWDEALESYYRADVETLADGTVKPRANPQALWLAVDLAIEEPWAEHLTRIAQPSLLIHAPENYGAAPLLPLAEAQETVQALADCTYTAVSCNHMTMVFDPYAADVVQAIGAFIQRHFDVPAASEAEV